MNRFLAPIIFLICLVSVLFRSGDVRGFSSEISILKGTISKINLKERYFDINDGSEHPMVRIYVDDPARLRGLREGLLVKVRVQTSKVVEGSYVAREIMIKGMRCRCDPTGVRARMKRAMKRGGWSCGGWSGHGTHK